MFRAGLSVFISVRFTACVDTEIKVGTLKMEATRFSETLVCSHHTTRRNSPENHEFRPTEYLETEKADFLSIKYKKRRKDLATIYKHHIVKTCGSVEAKLRAF
jgi:hypothetical protein